MPENLSKSFIPGPLTMLSEEEEMMKETGINEVLHICYFTFRQNIVDGPSLTHKSHFMLPEKMVV